MVATGAAAVVATGAGVVATGAAVVATGGGVAGVGATGAVVVATGGGMAATGGGLVGVGATGGGLVGVGATGGGVGTQSTPSEAGPQEEGTGEFIGDAVELFSTHISQALGQLSRTVLLVKKIGQYFNCLTFFFAIQSQPCSPTCSVMTLYVGSSSQQIPQDCGHALEWKRRRMV